MHWISVMFYDMDDKRNDITCFTYETLDKYALRRNKWTQIMVTLKSNMSI